MPLRVRFPKALRRAHELGTHFLVYAKVTDKEGGNEFVHTNHAWDVEVLGPNILENSLVGRAKCTTVCGTAGGMSRAGPEL
jgi:hypothetical protein